MKNLLAAKDLANAWSQWCCHGLLFTGAAYLFVMFLVLPLLSLLVTGVWLWTPAELLLSTLALSLLWGLLWGTANFWRACRALAHARQ